MHSPPYPPPPTKPGPTQLTPAPQRNHPLRRRLDLHRGPRLDHPPRRLRSHKTTLKITKMRRIDLLLPWLITLIQCACQNPGPKTTRPLDFWAVFSASAKQPGLQQFRNIALDSLLIGDTLLNTQSFITRCFSEVIDSPVLQRLNAPLARPSPLRMSNWKICGLSPGS